MADWRGFGADFIPQDIEQRNACFAHFDKNRDGVLDEKEFYNFCSELFTVDGRGHVISTEDSRAIMDLLSKGKGRIGRQEFEFCWKHWLGQILSPRVALLVVDVQHDFIDGSLALRACPACQDGVEVVPVINELLNLKYEVVVYTKDYHPANHISFFDNLNLRKLHPSSKVKANDAKLMDAVVFDSLPSVEQILWPVHCVEGTKGVEFHPDLKIAENHLVELKGTDPDVESYSVFVDNANRVNTSLMADLTARGITDIYVCGLATDFCVSKTAMDAVKLGYRTVVIEDATRGARVDTIDETTRELLRAGCLLCKASQVPAMVYGRTRHPQLGLLAARRAVHTGAPSEEHNEISKTARSHNQALTPNVTLPTEGITA